MKKVDLKKQRKLQLLLDTSYQLFTTQGFSDTTISDIVRHAGVAKGTFYLYFKDKEEIHAHLTSFKSAQLIRAAARETLDNHVIGFENRIIYMSNCLIEQLLNDRILLAFLSHNLSGSLFSPSYPGQLVQDLETALTQDEAIRIKDPEIMFFMIFELIGGVCYRAALLKQTTDKHLLRSYLLETIRNIVSRHTVPSEAFSL